MEEPKGKIPTKRNLGGFFNSFLAIYIADELRLDFASANTAIVKPFESSEIDSVVMGNGQLVVIETTKEYNLNVNHLKQKMYNAALIHLLDIPKNIYLYLTLFTEDKDMAGYVGHAVLYRNLKKRYKIPFHIVSLPKEYEKIKGESWKLDPIIMREIYSYYLTAIQEKLKTI